MEYQPHSQDPNVIFGNKRRFDLSALQSPSSGLGDMPSGTSGGPPDLSQPQHPQIPEDPNNPNGQTNPNTPKNEGEQQEYNKKCSNIRIKIYGYYNKLPEMMSLVTFPTPITSIMHWNLEQLEELYGSVLESRDAHSITGGALAHNAITNFIEVIGIQQGFFLNGFAQEVAVETEAQNLKIRLRQLVFINEIELGFGIKNPHVEYLVLMFGVAARRHMMLANSDRSMFVTAQQFELVPPDVEKEFSHL